MKKIIITFVIILITTNLFAELSRTKTIGEDTLLVIRNACREPVQGGDDLINHYYMGYKGNSKDDEETGEEIYDERGRGETFKTTTYMKKAFLGVIDVQ